LLLCSSYLPLGVPNGLYLQAIKQFSGSVAGEKEDFCKGSLARTIFYFVFSFALFYFCLHLFIKNTQKISFLCSCFYLLTFSLVRMSNPEVEVCTFKQQEGESLKDAWYRISNASCPIILGRPFLRTVGAIIDMKEGTIKYQFPLKKGMEHFPRRRKKLPFDSIFRANYELDDSSLDIT
jgi:hypothetical protein